MSSPARRLEVLYALCRALRGELPYQRRGGACLLDLHLQLGTGMVRAVPPAADARAHSLPLPVGGGRGRDMSPTQQVLQNLPHAAVLELAGRSST